jgi:hypothetical protein
MRRIAEGADIATAAALAREIWIRHYVPIIGQAQTDYMIAKFQSPEAIARQIAGGYQYYLVIADGEPVGYFALVPGPAEHRALLSKIYEALAEPLAFKRLAGTLALQIRGERRFLHWRASVPASRRVGFAGASKYLSPRLATFRMSAVSSPKSYRSGTCIMALLKA